MEERTLAGQNISFHRDFLEYASERAGHSDWVFACRATDTYTLGYMHIVARGPQPPVRHKRSALDLDSVLNSSGIPEEPHPHNGLTGALSHADVIFCLLYGRNIPPEFEAV